MKRTPIAEAAKLDLLFLEDGVAVRELDMSIASRTPRAVYFEPVTLLSALAVTTQNIGLVATASSTYHEPYNIARRFASIDHISGGRAGWNLVTSQIEDEAGKLVCISRFTVAVIPVAEAQVSYRVPARYDDLLTVETSLAEVKRASARFGYRLLRDGEVLATGHTVHACVDLEGRIRRMPAELLARLGGGEETSTQPQE